MRTKHYITLIILIFLLCGTVCVTASEFLDDNSSVKVNKISAQEIRKIEKLADKYFYDGIESEDYNTKEAYLSRALEKYMLLLKLKPDDVTICTQIAVIHDNLNHTSLARDYFIRAVNLENLNPFANFYYGEYYFAKRDYQNALNYYLTAYNNGYKNSFPVNLKLATVYEKLGDIEKARNFYKAAEKQNPAQKGLSAKIKSMEKIYYSKSDYNRN